MSFEIKKSTNTKKIGVSSLEDDNSDIITTSRKGKENDPFLSSPNPPNSEVGMEYLVEDDEEDDEEGSQEEEYEEQDDFLNEPDEEPQGMSYEDIQEKKAKCLSQLKRYKKRGIFVERRLGMEHSLQEIEGEVYRIKKELEIDHGISYLRTGLMFCVNTIEIADKNFKFGADLEGWGGNIYNDIDSYDDVLEELYEKWVAKNSGSPELRFMMMIAGSAFMYSYNKKMGNIGSRSTRQREMSGPSEDTDELLRELNDSDDESDIGSLVSEEPEPEPEIKVPVKKRGRPKKQ